MSDELETSVEVADVSTETPISTETETVEPASNPATAEETVTDAPKEEFQFDDEILEETEKIVAEAQAEAERTQTPLEKHLRKVISSKVLESRKPLELGETEQQAMDLYRALHSFDNETGRPTARAFAQKLVEKDVTLATEAAWDIFNQPLDANGMTVGHSLMERMGLDPYKLEEYRQYTRGEIKGTQYGIVEVPDNVPPEYVEAYKSLSEVNRNDVDLYIDAADTATRQAGLEILRNKQAMIDFDRMRTESEQQRVETFQRDVNVQIEKEERETFTNMIESFKETPTYKNATISGIPEVDSSIKDTITMSILQLGDLSSISGQQALKFFENWGVLIDPKEITTLIDEISGNIQSAVKAEKGNYQSARVEAVARKEEAIKRANAKRNAIFAQTYTAIANKFKATSEAQSQVIGQNGGMPVINGQPQTTTGEPKLSTLEMIQQMSRTANG